MKINYFENQFNLQKVNNRTILQLEKFYTQYLVDKYSKNNIFLYLEKVLYTLLVVV